MSKVSIIIPVYNNFELTLMCINSIKKHCMDNNYEIIVVDDCSTDDTSEFFKLQDEVRYIRNKYNRGFAYTCNRGAEVAEGDYLLFLNNDTLIKNNFIKIIIESFTKYKDAAILGAKLLYNDNTIQHAGVLIYPDKHLGHLFKNFPSNYPDANKIRELQAVTGACLAIRKELFFKVNMFDENFINGFEDIDLCFKIRELGYKIIYNPNIFLIHLEEKTRKKFKTENDKKNSELLSKRWIIKASPDFFLLDEGYDFKLNCLGEFYLIKKNFQHIEGVELLNSILIEPLYFDGYKKLISQLLEKKDYKNAEIIANRLIMFEPIIDNFKILKKIIGFQNDINRLNSIDEIIKNFEEQKILIKNRIKYIFDYLVKQGNFKVSRYYEEWLKNC